MRERQAEATPRPERRRDGLPLPNHHLLEALIQASPLAIAGLDRDGRVLVWNPAAERIFGWPAADVIGEPLPIIPPDRAGESDALLRAGLDGRVAHGIETRRARRDGTELHVSVSKAPIRDARGRIVGIMAVYLDLTDRKRAEAALQESEERHRELIENAIDIVYTRDLDGTITSINRAAEVITGHSVQELIGKNILDLIAPEERDRVRATIEGSRAGRDPEPYEVEIRTKDGAHRVLEINSWLVRRNGRPVAVHGFARDISQWKKVASAIEQSERYFRSLIENTLDVIAVLDEDLRFRFASPSVKRVLGYPPEELMGRNVMELIHPDDAPTVMDLIQLGLKTPGFIPTVTIRLRHADGNWRFIEGIGENLVNDPAVKGIVVNARDVTDRTMAERGLHRSLGVLRRTDQERRRLLAHLVTVQEEERSRIAAEIHDDSLQVVTAAGVRIESLARRTMDPKVKEELTELQEGVAGAVGRLRKLLFDVRPPALDREGLEPALRLALNQLRLDTGIEWQIHGSLAADPPDALRTILYRIAMEALTNVRKHAGASRIELDLEERDGGVRLSVRDDGAGFPPERLEEEVPGHLGLITMRQRAQLAGGRLHVDTGPGKGTAVVAWIPLVPGTVSGAT